MRENYKKIDNVDDKVKEFGYDSLCLQWLKEIRWDFMIF